MITTEPFDNGTVAITQYTDETQTRVVSWWVVEEESAARAVAILETRAENKIMEDEYENILCKG